MAGAPSVSEHRSPHCNNRPACGGATGVITSARMIETEVLDMTLTIRAATRDDIPALQRLIPESARALSVGFYTPDEIEIAVAHVFGVDTQLIDDGTYFVAEVGGEIIGCGGWSRRKTLFGGDQYKASASDDLLDPATEPARIRAFFVHPNWARRGIGGQILKTCEVAAKSAGFTQLELVATLPGEPLYAAFGFEALERIQIEVGGGTLPAVRMVKREWCVVSSE